MVVGDDTRLRFGGCLVCQLLLCRRGIFYSFRAMQELQKRIAATIEEMLVLDSGERFQELCDQADRLLECMLDSLRDMTPDKARQALLPIYLHQNALTWNDGGRISALLELLCATESQLWREFLKIRHDLRHLVSDLGGGLATVHNRNASGQIAQTMRRDCDMLALFLGHLPVDLYHRIARVTLSAYQGSEYHVAAANMMLEKIESTISIEPGITQQFNGAVEELIAQFTHGPQVGGLIDVLGLISPSYDVATETLKDPAVLELLSSIASGHESV